MFTSVNPPHQVTARARIQALLTSRAARTLLTISSFVIGVFTVAGCGGSSSDGASLRIGVLSSDTGALESFGPVLRTSLQIAERDINKRLTDEGSSVSLSFEYADTATNPETALAKMSEMKDRGVRFFIGPVSSGEVEAVRQFALDNDLLVISPSATSATLSRSDDTVLRTVGSDEGQGFAIAAALQHFGTRFYCPIWRADPFGDDIVLQVGKEFQRRGGNFAPGSRYDEGTTDFTEALEQLEIQLDAYVDFFGSRSAAVYAVAFDEIFQLISDANTNPVLAGVRWYGSDGIAFNPRVLSDPSVVDFAKKTELLSPIFVGDRNAPDFLRVRGEIEGALGGPVRPYGLLAYDAALLLAAVAKETDIGSLPATAVRDAIIARSSSVTGASGSLTLNENGDRPLGEYEFWKLVDGPPASEASPATSVWKLAGVLDISGGSYESSRFIPIQ